MDKIPQEELQKLKEMVEAGQDVNACVALYLNLRPNANTCVASRDEIAKWIESHRKDNDLALIADIFRLESMVKENPEYGYFHRYDYKPITFKWLRDHLGMRPDPQKTTNLLTFLQNGNVIRIRSACEYATFIAIMAKHELSPLLAPRKALYEDIIKLYKLPQNIFKHPDWDGTTLYAECQNGKESIALYPYTVRATVEWYGTEPMSVDDIDDRGLGE